MPAKMHDDEVDIDEGLVRRLLDAQMPELADQPLALVEPWGTDNAIWRLGTDLVVRLPRIAWARGQPEREAKWLPRLAPYLPIVLPEPVAVGDPDFGYPFPWAVHGWIPGRGASPDTIGDPVTFALDLAAAVRSLQRAGGRRACGTQPRSAGSGLRRFHPIGNRASGPSDQRRSSRRGLGGSPRRPSPRRAAGLGAG
ncbi:MAG: phosphotransferase [Acidimicrobiia bacterium]|nr:phosphotransferase [Acidimicrobiia bacterium]